MESFTDMNCCLMERPRNFTGLFFSCIWNSSLLTASLKSYSKQDKASWASCCSLMSANWPNFLTKGTANRDIFTGSIFSYNFWKVSLNNCKTG